MNSALKRHKCWLILYNNISIRRPNIGRTRELASRNGLTHWRYENKEMCLGWNGTNVHQLPSFVFTPKKGIIKVSYSLPISNYWMRLSMIARIIKAEVCVICRSRRLRRIAQTEALIISLSCENRIQKLFYYTIINVQALRHFTEQQQSKPRNDTFQCKHLY